MVVHKRTEQWDGLPFGSLDEAAEFIAEFESRLKLEDGGQTSASVATEERDFRELTLDELRELSKALPVSEMQSLTASCGGDGKRGFRVNLILINDTRSSTHLDVEGEDEVVVDGLYVGAKKKIDHRFETIRDAERLVEAKGEPHGDGQNVSEGRIERWLVEIVGGATAAVLAAGVIYLLSQ